MYNGIYLERERESDKNKSQTLKTFFDNIFKSNMINHTFVYHTHFHKLSKKKVLMIHFHDINYFTLSCVFIYIREVYIFTLSF